MSTKADLIAQLGELGIDPDPSSTKAELVAMLAQSTPDVVSTPADRTSRPVWDAGESRSEYHARLRAWKLEQRR